MKLGGDPIQIAPGVRHLDRQEFLIILRQRLEESDHCLQPVAQITGNSKKYFILVSHQCLKN